MGLKPRRERVAVEWFTHARRRNPQRRYAAGGKIAESTDEELLDSLIGPWLGLGWTALGKSFCEEG